MIDMMKEQLLSLSEAARPIPAIDGKRPHPSTLFRWIRDGVRGGVRLEHVRLGGRILTTNEAISRFMHAAADAPAPATIRHAQAPQQRTPRQRQAAMDAARERLAAAGLVEVSA